MVPFGAQLVLAGVDTVVIREIGVTHGHLNEPDESQAMRTLGRIVDWLTSSRLVGQSHEAQAEPAELVAGR